MSTSTLRHYERLGLLPEVRRTGPGHRRYDRIAVDRVHLIQRALVVGFSLADLRRVLSVRDKGGAPCHSVRALVAGRVGTLANQINDLRALHRELRALLADWDQRLAETAAGERAHLLDDLAKRPGIGRHATRSTRRFLHSSRRDL